MTRPFPRLTFARLARAGRWLAALLLVVGLAGVAPRPAAASPLEDAKKAGLVGEQPDGYVGLVTGNAPANVVALVREVNAKRRAAYQQIAAQKSIPIEDVAALAAEKVYSLAQPGEYLLINGKWVRK
jgi:uncharacterized protein YdbL (DUF1318 family)